MTVTRSEAAAARGDAILQRSDRPGQRRAAEAPSALPRVASRARIEVRAAAPASSLREFDGIASVTDHGYDMWDWAGPYTEKVTPGAFQKTLSQKDLDVPLVLGHDSMRRIARTTNGSLTLSETDEGLRSLAPELDTSDADVAYILPKIESGLIDEMSFRFSITAGEWSSDWTEYHINEVDLQRGDVSIVGYGANPATSISLRSIGDKLARGVKLNGREIASVEGALCMAPTDADRIRSLTDFTPLGDEELRDEFARLRHYMNYRGVTPRMSTDELEARLAA